MEKVTTIVDSQGTEHIQIEVSEGHFISMPKTEYDRRQEEAALSTPIVSGDE